MIILYHMFSVLARKRCTFCSYWLFIELANSRLKSQECASWIFKEKLTMPKIAGFLIVLFGIMLVNGKMTVSEGNRWGLLCGALSAVMYFFMVTLNKRSHKIVGMENAVIQLTVSFLTVAVLLESSMLLSLKYPPRHGRGFCCLVLSTLDLGAICISPRCQRFLFRRSPSLVI